MLKSRGTREGKNRGISQGKKTSGRQVSGPLAASCDGAFRSQANRCMGWIGDLGHTALAQLRKLFGRNWCEGGKGNIRQMSFQLLPGTGSAL